MSRAVKMLIGLAAVLLMGWISHGPLGRGEAFVAGVEAGARAAVAATDLTGVEVRLGRNPLSRTALLSGPADDFQRRGMGSQPGLTQIVEEVDGVGAVRWEDEASGGSGLPLLAETLALVALAYLLGLGLGWLLWGRPRREGFA